LKKLSERKLK